MAWVCSTLARVMMSSWTTPPRSSFHGVNQRATKPTQSSVTLRPLRTPRVRKTASCTSKTASSVSHTTEHPPHLTSPHPPIPGSVFLSQKTSLFLWVAKESLWGDSGVMWGRLRRHFPHFSVGTKKYIVSSIWRRLNVVKMWLTAER